MKIPKPALAFFRNFGAVSFMILFLVIIGFIARHQSPSPTQQTHKPMVNLADTLAGELDKLSMPLKSLGFDLINIKSQCPRANNDNGGSNYCNASLNSFVKYKDDTALKSISQNAQMLSDDLNANGWTQRADYPTAKWFDNIAQGVDYQPDQLNTKALGDVSCTVDFFTSFSKPAVPAVTLSAFCSQGTLPNIID